MACTHKILEQRRVRPPPSSVPATSLALTFFDMPMLRSDGVRCLYLYEFPHPTHHFTQTVLPTLTHSLSLTLQHFFPLVGNLMCPPPPSKPYIFYTQGDSIPLTIAESTAIFDHLKGYHPQDIKHFDHLVPKLHPPTQISNDTDTFVFPLLAIQVTVFPDSGICVAVSNRHVIDGRIRSLFMKSWASAFKTGGLGDESLRPFYDRDVIKDPNGVMAVFLEEYFRMRSTWKEDIGSTAVFHGHNVTATYVLNGAEIESLKQRCEKANEHYSTQQQFTSFVVACAFIWVCRMKTDQFHEGAATRSTDDDELSYFGFPADCRNRLEFPVPSTYFGNCLAYIDAVVKTSELVGENGFVVAAKAIAREISKLKSKPLEGAEKWMENIKNLVRRRGRVLIVGGSPRFNDYGTDFGWGRPEKFSVVNYPRSMSLADSREDDGALEVGVVLTTRAAMDTFSSIFEQSLKLPY